jgi:hypothetical protein
MGAADRQFRLGALLLFLGVLIAFWPLGRADFLNYDDPVFIELNRRLDAGFTLENLRWAFTANLLYFSPSLEYWSPLTALSRLWDVTLWGKDPWGHHLTSVLLHGLSAVTLLAAVRKLTGHTGAALWVAAVFAFHPTSAEPVAWLSARKDVVYGLFWNLTLLAYAGYARAPGRATYLRLLAAFLLAAMSKPMVLTLPCVLLLLDLWPLGRFRIGGEDAAGQRTFPWKLLLEKLPFFAVSALLAWLAMFSQRGWNAVAPEDLVPAGRRLANVLLSYGDYLRLAFWPRGHSPFHPFAEAVPAWQLGLAGALLVGISGLALWNLRKRPWLAVGWFWFCGVLFPVSGLVQIGSSRIAERYMYVALPGMALAVAWLALEIKARLPGLRQKIAGYILAEAGVGLAVLMAAFSMHLAWVWQQPTRVWKAAREVYPRSRLVTGQYANAAWDIREYRTAGPLYSEVLRAKPDDAPALLGVARLLREKGDLRGAAEFYGLALQSNATLTTAQIEYADVLIRQGRAIEARQVLRELTGRVPYLVGPWRQLARLEAATGSREDALKSMERHWQALRVMTN